MMAKRFKGWMLLFVCLVLVFPNPVNAAEPDNSLALAQQRVTVELARMDAALKQAAQKLGVGGLTGDAARVTLRELCAAFPYAVDCTAINAQGVMVTVEPAKYRHVEGTDIREQPQIVQVLQHKKPVLSSLFRAVEGFQAMDAEYPVFSSAGQLMGSVSLLFEPEKMLEQSIKPTVQGTPLSIWVINREGQILYDADRAQVGLNLFLARGYQPYPELIQMGKQIVENDTGSGKYEFPSVSSPTPVRKNATWQSAGLYGSQWRLVMIQTELEASGQKMGTPLPVLQAEQALESLSKEPVLAIMLKRNDKVKIMEILKGFYEETPGIYSVQWIDPQGINRFGYPAENSLTDYDYRNGRRVDDALFVQAVQARKSAQIDAPLFEGIPGRFDLKPVIWRDQYLGMVYIIQVR